MEIRVCKRALVLLAATPLLAAGARMESTAAVTLDVSGPASVAVGGKIELVASASVGGGSYEWEVLLAKSPAASPRVRLANPRIHIVPRGNRAILVGRAASTAVGDIAVRVSFDKDGQTARKTVRLTVVTGDLVAYRPQHRTGYFPLPRLSVPNDKETDDSLGPGIRINGPGEADPNTEDDLIEVKLSVSHDVPFALQRSSSTLSAWTTRTKAGGTELVFSGDQTQALPIVGGNLTLWIEWTGAHGLADLRLVPAGASARSTVDRLRFHSFRAIVMSLGGEGQAPSNPVDPNHGSFIVGRDLYELGYDVHLYDEDNVFASGLGPVYTEVVNAVSKRSVEEVVSFGYSHGGGSTYDLVERLDLDRGSIGTFQMPFTSYVDGVENDSDVDLDQENRRPPSSGFHANHYQIGSFADFFLDGGPVPNSNPSNTGLNVETTPWGAGATHFLVDDYVQVVEYIRTHLTQNVTR